MLLCFEPVWFWWRCNCSVWTLSDLMGLRVRVYLITGTFHWDQWSWSWALWAELDQNRSDVTPGSNHSMFLISGNFCWSPAPFWELCPFLSSACFGINIPALFLVALLVVWFWSSWIMDPDPFSTDTTAGWVTLRTRKTDPGSDCQNINSVQLNFHQAGPVPVLLTLTHRVRSSSRLFPWKRSWYQTCGSSGSKRQRFLFWCLRSPGRSDRLPASCPAVVCREESPRCILGNLGPSLCTILFISESLCCCFPKTKLRFPLGCCFLLQTPPRPAPPDKLCLLLVFLVLILLIFVWSGIQARIIV